MNYILFGGSGFIGTHLIHLLLKECVRPGDMIYDLDPVSYTHLTLPTILRV